MRAIASFAVLVFHVAAETATSLREGFAGALLARGDVAVPIFFALSGLLLYRPYALHALRGGPPVRVRAYLWRRAVRILPAYWLVVVTAMLLWSRDHVSEAWTWIQLLLLGQNYDLTPWWYALGPKGLVQMWSLSVEAAFYLLLPLIAAGLAAFARRGGDDVRRRAHRLLTGVGAVGAVSLPWTVLTYYPEHRPYLNIWPPRSAIFFAAGMAMAVVVAWIQADPDEDSPARRFRRAVEGSPGSWLLVGALAYAVAASPVTGTRFFGVDGLWSGVFEIVLYTVVAVCLLVPATLPPPGDSPLRRVLGNRVMGFLGRVSYGVFLWQFVAIHLWYDFTGQRPFTGGFLLNLVPITALTLLLAVLTHRYVERPALRLNRLVR
ncbi:peptidoglycan/LPS O-acetylase OafA/YrhL [Streptosporangium becharense]|uniref:Peptidoglycan/LPS O-acetylase OafA/YrhL n=1 Tax=Streptosporangium becharense TaxID=1816182 RepID=A0A7W9IFA2_9ACTN|nr:acyltransferase [Streptosporangium becharense]MBB2909783.1 peptidoglycan/LPS O-acetylase OafA/YrhL [Streptosporangium becharense]MBB5819261.1 peptidoglycan/LPS O-acetylase OafA/YrhL [Streptosporangium becharense]